MRRSKQNTVDAIYTMDRDQLVRHWEEHHGILPPKGIGTHLLRVSAAYFRQTSCRERLDIEGRLKRDTNRPARQALTPGTILVREWHGRTYRVEALEKGVLLEGRTFSSLTAVAKHITGTKRSGPAFFGTHRVQMARPPSITKGIVQ